MQTQTSLYYFMPTVLPFAPNFIDVFTPQNLEIPLGLGLLELGAQVMDCFRAMTKLNNALLSPNMEDILTPMYHVFGLL